MHHLLRGLFVGVCITPVVICAQSPAAPTFEVASVKQNMSDSSASSSKDSPGTYTAINMPLRRLIALAYRIHPAVDRDRIIRPSWIDGVRFDITARTPVGTRSDQIPGMLRALLAARFSLVTHTETREGTAFALVRARTDGVSGRSSLSRRWIARSRRRFSAGARESKDGTPIVTALQEQLGLKLEAQRAPVEFLIIDRIERPSPD